MSNMKKLMMTAAAGDGLVTNVEDVFDTVGFYGDPNYAKTGVEFSTSLAATTEFSYAEFGPGEYHSEFTQATSACDSQGNIYVLADSGNTNPSTDSSMVIQKFSPNFTEVLWKVGIQNTTSTETESPYNIMVSENDNLYVMAMGRVGNQAGATLTRINTTTGAIIWSKGYPESGSDAPGRMISEDSSGTYVYFAHYAYDGNSQQPMVSKFAVSNGAVQWDKVYYWSTNDSEEAYGIKVVDDNNIFLTGYTRASYRYAYVIGINASGTLQNAIRFASESTRDYYGYGLATDGTYLYATGGGIGHGYYVAKFDTSLNVQALKYFYSSSATNVEGRAIHYGSDGNLTIIAEGEQKVNGISKNGYCIIRHDTTNLNQISGERLAFQTVSSGNCGIEGEGTKQTVFFQGDKYTQYNFAVTQFDVTDLSNLGPNPVMPGLFEPDATTVRTTTYSNTSNPNTGNGRQTWSSNIFTSVPPRPIEVLRKGYYPEVLAADAGGIVITNCVTANADKHILDNNISSGATSRLITNRTNAATSETGELFGTGGIALTKGKAWQGQYQSNCATAFKKHPKFFDVVTYTGTGSNRTVSHNLGSVPGAIWVKRTDSTGSWICYHRGNDATAPEDYANYLDFTNARTDNSVFWNDTAPTSSVFTVGTNNAVNASGGTYVAYLFAHNDGDGTFGVNADMDIIKCDSYTGDGGSPSAEIDVGFEPQWILIKNRSSAADWLMVNTETNLTFTHNSLSNNYMYTGRSFLNTTDPTYDNIINVRPTSKGFVVHGNNVQFNASGNIYTYIAIRKNTRFAQENRVADLFTTRSDSSYSRPETLFPSAGKSMVIGHVTTAGSSHSLFDRTTGTTLYTNGSNSGEAGGSYSNYAEIPTTPDHAQYGSMIRQRAISGYPGFYNMWKQQGGFFDIATWIGDSTAGRQIPHQLQSVPAMIWVKSISSNGDWIVYHKDTNFNNDNASETDWLKINSFQAAQDSSSYWNDTAPTDTHFTVGSAGSVNYSGYSYVAYIFGETPGVSSLGTYTGNGSSTGPIIDCGFINTPRYILIKSVDSNENWVHFNSDRGIGNDYNDRYMTLNTSDTENSGANWIEPTSTGFQLKNGGTLANRNGYRYVYYAIA